MQSSKIVSIMDALDMCDPKTAMKVHQKEMDKNGKKISQDAVASTCMLFSKAAILYQGGKNQEAAEEFKAGLEAMQKSKDGASWAQNFQLIRSVLIQITTALGVFSLARSPHYKQFVDTLSEMNSKLKSNELTEILHDMSLHTNNYQQFGQLASKLGFANPKKYMLNSVQAFYHQSFAEGASPQLMDMAEMFAKKYQKDGHLESG